MVGFAYPPGVLGFDIGGTWFRSACIHDGSHVTGLSKTPAMSFRSHPGWTEAALQSALVDYLVDEARRQGAALGAAPAVVSLGAALNGHTGEVFGSGPLWGPAGGSFDLGSALRARAPDRRWIVVNDVTAALLAHVAAEPAGRGGRMGLVTVSSGIAARAYDFERQVVPLDPQHGLQGEIGHLPVRFERGGRSQERLCDCGGERHLSAYCSGRGIERLLAEESRGDPAALAAGAEAGVAWALEFLGDVTRPLAELVAVMLTHDPELDPLVVTGGVVGGLGRPWQEALLQHLERGGLYQITARDPGYFRRRLRFAADDDLAGLRGCAVAAATLGGEPRG